MKRSQTGSKNDIKVTLGKGFFRPKSPNFELLVNKKEEKEEKEKEKEEEEKERGRGKNRKIRKEKGEKKKTKRKKEKKKKKQKISERTSVSSNWKAARKKLEKLSAFFGFFFLFEIKAAAFRIPDQKQTNSSHIIKMSCFLLYFTPTN